MILVLGELAAVVAIIHVDFLRRLQQRLLLGGVDCFKVLRILRIVHLVREGLLAGREGIQRASHLLHRSFFRQGILKVFFMLFDVLVIVLGAVNRLSTLKYLRLNMLVIVVTRIRLLLDHLVLAGGVFHDLLRARYV